LAEYFLYLVLVGRLMRIPVVVSVHGADVDRHTTDTVARRLIRRLVMRGAHQVVACSAAMVAQTIDVFPFVRTKITHVHNGLNPSDLPMPPGTGTPAPIQPCLLTVARQVAKKGIDTLLRAFALLERDFLDLRLVIVGDGPKIEEHRRLARELGIESRTTFAIDPPRLQVLRYFAACSVVVVPSRAEPFGLVVLEGAYYSKPMVCT